jgi:hypothetical protein
LRSFCLWDSGELFALLNFRRDPTLAGAIGHIDPLACRARSAARLFVESYAPD